jgi:hypothetical protein
MGTLCLLKAKALLDSPACRAGSDRSSLETAHRLLHAGRSHLQRAFDAAPNNPVVLSRMEFVLQHIAFAQHRLARGLVAPAARLSGCAR